MMLAVRQRTIHHEAVQRGRGGNDLRSAMPRPFSPRMLVASVSPASPDRRTSPVSGADDTMASPRFILKTDLSGLEPVTAGGGAVIDADARLRALLGPERAALFAEPVVTWGNGRNAGSVSWYAEAAGDPVPLSALPPARRAGAGDRKSVV
jgi:hypothetical protein